MAILWECEACKRRYPMKRPSCCGGKKVAAFWVDVTVRPEGAPIRHRERVGPSIKAAQYREREIKQQACEACYIPKVRRLSFDDLAAWYFNLPVVQRKRSIARDRSAAAHLSEFFSSVRISTGEIESYVATRRKAGAAPGTVKREVAVLKTMMERARRHWKIGELPEFPKVKGSAPRKRVVSKDEFKKILQHSPSHLRPILKVAYTTGLRLREVVELTWNEVDRDAGGIRLDASRTKTQTERFVPLPSYLLDELVALEPYGGSAQVFTRDGKPIKDIRRVFATAVKKAGLTDVHFHDFRRSAINNLRLAGNDLFQVAAVSGHKSANVFRDYNHVSEAELKERIKW